MSDISFNTACKELKIAQIAQLNKPFQLLHFAHIYGHDFFYVSRMLLRKNVNNDVSKNLSIGRECRPTEVLLHMILKIGIVPNGTEWPGRKKLHCYASQSLVSYESWKSLSAHCLCIEKRVPKGTLVLRSREIRRIQLRLKINEWMNLI